jgi:hypothetical protein
VLIDGCGDGEWLARANLYLRVFCSDFNNSQTTLPFFLLLSDRLGTTPVGSHAGNYQPREKGENRTYTPSVSCFYGFNPSPPLSPLSNCNAKCQPCRHVTVQKAAAAKLAAQKGKQRNSIVAAVQKNKSKVCHKK